MDLERTLFLVFSIWASTVFHFGIGLTLQGELPEEEPRQLLEFEVRMEDSELQSGDPLPITAGAILPADGIPPRDELVSTELSSGDEQKITGHDINGRSDNGVDRHPTWKRLWAERERAFEEHVSMKKDKIEVLTNALGEDSIGNIASRNRGICGTVPETGGSFRNLKHLAPLLPSATFDPLYVLKIKEWKPESAPGKTAMLRNRVMALPQQQLHLLLDSPRGYLASIGSPRGPCRVDVTLGKYFFPIHFSRIPLHVVSDKNVVSYHLVDATLDSDGSFTIIKDHLQRTPFRQGKLPFSQSFANSTAIQMAVALAIQSVGLLFENDAESSRNSDTRAGD